MHNWEIILAPSLVEVYELDRETLQTNRQGRMTDKQRQRLQQVRQRRLRRRGLLVGITFLMLFGTAFTTSGRISNSEMWILRGVLALIFLVHATRTYSFYRLSAQEIRDGRVRMYPGRLHKVTRPGERVLYCETGEFRNLTNQEWDAFEHRLRYRVYSTPYTNLIVGAHPVHRDEPLPEAWSRRDDRL